MMRSRCACLFLAGSANAVELAQAPQPARAAEQPQAVKHARANSFTFTTYTSIGEEPDCNSDFTKQFKKLLGIEPEYPDARLFQQLKAVGFKKLLGLTLKPKSDASAQQLPSSSNAAASPQGLSFLNNPAVPADELIPLALTPLAMNPLAVTPLAVTPLAVTPPITAADAYVASVLASSPATPPAPGVSAKLQTQSRRRTRSKPAIPAQTPAQIPALNQPPITSDAVGGSASFDSANFGGAFGQYPPPSFADGQPDASPLGGQRRRLDSVNLVDKFLTQTLALASAQVAPGENDALLFGADDLRVSRFTSGVFLTTLADQVVGRATLSMRKPQAVVALESPMINVGEAICRSCSNAAINDPEHARGDTCLVATILRNALVCSNGSQPNVDCEASPPAPYTFESCDMYQQHPGSGFVAEIQIDTAVLDSTQGNMDYWLFQASNALYHYAQSNAYCQPAFEKEEFLPGWKTIGQTQMDQQQVLKEQGLFSEGAPEVTVPTGVLLAHPTRRCEFVAVNRGTQTTIDWMIDFQTSQVELVVRDQHLGRGHAGFANIAAPTAAFFTQLIQEACPNTPVKLTLTGHSMGGGVALIEGLLFSEWLPKADIAVVAFAAPHALDAEAAAALQKRTRVRAWLSAFDAVPRIPCSGSPGMMRCPSLTGQSGSEVDHYAETPNEIVIQAKELGRFMPSIVTDSFGELFFNMAQGSADISQVRIPGPLQLSESHSQAYLCWFTTNFCSRGISSKCG